MATHTSDGSKETAADVLRGSRAYHRLVSMVGICLGHLGREAEVAVQQARHLTLQLFQPFLTVHLSCHRRKQLTVHDFTEGSEGSGTSPSHRSI